jgi:hypothetical protein
MIVQGEINFTGTTVGGALLPSLEQLKTANFFGPGTLIAKVSANITSMAAPPRRTFWRAEEPRNLRRVPGQYLAMLSQCR